MHRSHRCRVLVSVYSGMYPGVTGADGAAAHCWVIRTAVLRSGLLALASARPQESSTAGSRVAGLLLIYGPLCLGKMFSSCLCNTFGHSHNQKETLTQQPQHSCSLTICFYKILCMMRAALSTATTSTKNYYSVNFHKELSSLLSLPI